MSSHSTKSSTQRSEDALREAFFTLLVFIVSTAVIAGLLLIAALAAKANVLLASVFFGIGATCFIYIMQCSKCCIGWGKGCRGWVAPVHFTMLACSEHRHEAEKAAQKDRRKDT